MEVLQWMSKNSSIIGGVFTPLITSVSVIVGGVFTSVRWLDTRNREIDAQNQEREEKRFSKYMELINLASGKCPDERQIMLVEQLAAVWFLLEYPKYKEITCRIFSDALFERTRACH
jgi:hypothetical protein